MVDHSLAIRSFRTRLDLAGRAEDGPALGREVDRTVRDILPGAASAALEPLLGSRSGVLRINRVAVSLRFGRAGFSARLLAESFSRAIARAVAERAAGAATSPRLGDGVAYWPDHDAFAAAYLARRLGLATAPGWAFPDFGALDLLSPHEALVELAAARPELFAALARLLTGESAPALAARLPEKAALLLIERLSGPSPPGLPAGAGEILSGMLAALHDEVGRSPGRATIVAAARRLAALPDADAPSVRHGLLLARLAVALAAVRAAILHAHGRAPAPPDLAPRALALLPEPARALALDAIAPLSADPVARAQVARIMRRSPRRLAGRPAAAPPPGAAVEEAPTVVTSRIAGIGLLLPAALAHDLPALLAAAALHRTMAAALGPAEEGKARQDSLLAVLAPFDPRDAPVFPPVPDSLRAAVPAERRDGEAAAEGAAGWAACLAHAFASRLTGFEGSSLPYLRRQFLARPGRLTLAGDRLTLTVDPLPLGILLRHFGLHGWTGHLPHLGDALLRIEIREG